MYHVFRKGIQKTSNFLYHTNDAYWYRADLNDQEEIIFNNEDISVDFSDQDKTIRFIEEHGYYYPREMEIGLIEGHLFTSIKSKDKIIGYNKTGFKSVYIDDFKRIYQFPLNVAFTYDTYIAPEFRGHGYGLMLLYRVCSYLRNKRFKAMWGHIPPWNKASEVMHRKLGFQRYQMISYHSIAGLSWTSCNPVKLIQRVENEL